MKSDLLENHHDAQAHWFSAWNKSNYSWDGLKNKPLKGWSVSTDGELKATEKRGQDTATLQDYWRCDPTTHKLRSDDELFAIGELIRSPTGSAWHLVHSPFDWPGGEPCKSHWSEDEWQRLTEVIGLRLAVAAPFDPKGPILVQKNGETEYLNSTPDERCQLRGAQLRELRGKGQHLYINCHETAFIGVVDISENNTTGICNFSRCLFVDNVVFDNSNLSEQLRFDGSIFCEDVMIRNSVINMLSARGCSFYNRILFNRSRFFGLFFSNAIIHGISTFIGCKFDWRAIFDEVRFLKPASFEDASFKGVTTYSKSSFEGGVVFDSCRFSDDAIFSNAYFIGSASFRSAVFGSKSSKNAKIYFMNSEFHRSGRFDGCVFWSDVDFGQIKIKGYLSFFGSTFFGAAKMVELVNSGHLTCQSAMFHSSASFVGSRFGSSDNFSSAKFLGMVEFERAIFPGTVIFEEAIFSQVVSFENALFEGPTLFRKTTFHSVPAFEGARLHPDATFDNARFTALDPQSMLGKAFQLFVGSLWATLIIITLPILVYSYRAAGQISTLLFAGLACVYAATALLTSIPLFHVE